MKKHLLLFFAALLPLLASASPVTSLAELNNGCLYHISQPYRNNTSWAVAQGGTELMSNVTLGIENDVNDPCQQFAILSNDGGNSYYLYHVAEAKFVNNDGSLNDIPEDAIKFKNGAYDGTFVMYFDRAKHVNINSEKSLVIDNWSTADGGNSCEILPVGEYDLTEVLRIVPGIEKVEVDGIAYNLTKKDKLAVVTSRAVGYVGNITIPSMLRHENVEYTVRGIGSDAFADCANLTSINLPTSVTSIGNAAFYNCTNLISINISEGSQLTSIGEYAFYNCSSLASVTIPESVTSIGNYAFYNCSGLGSVAFFENSQLTHIGEYAFYRCAGLTNIDIPEGVTDIKRSAFNSCSSLSSVTIPESVTSIGNYAFYNCTNLININISEGSQLTSIGDYAFGYCSSLTSVTIPEGVTSIGPWAFYGCTGLGSVTFLENSQLISIGFRAFEDCRSLTAITIPEGVTSIGSSAFSYCSSLADINIPEGVTSIGGYAFYRCSSLTSVTIPASVTSIEEYAFSGCTGLASVTFLENSQLTSIGDYAFEDCSRLTSVTIPASVTSIEQYAFSGCTGLGSVTFLENSQLTSIGNYAFYNTAWYENQPDGVVYAGKVLYEYKGTMPENTFIEVKEGTKGIASSAFHSRGSLVAITIPESVTSIGGAAFRNCTSLTTITIPEGVTSIESSVFSGCSSLTSVTIPEGVASIGMSAFENCSSLADITLPESVTSIGWAAFYGTAWYDNQPDGVLYLDKWLLDYKGTMPNNTSINVKEGTKGIADFAFSGCTGLTSVTIPEGVTSIGNAAFEDCSSLAGITIPESVTNIGYSAFYGTAWYDNQPDGVLYLDKWLLRYKGTMPNNTSINVKEGTKGIADYAFSGCTGLTSVIIPEGVMSIGNSAFSGCTGLGSVTFLENSQLTSIGEYAFYNCSSLTAITIPESVTSIGDYAFEYCRSLESITCKTTTPPTVAGQYVFGNVDNFIPVYVPAESVEAYKAAPYWSEFTNILPLANEFTLTVSAAGYATLFLGYDVAIPDGVEVYIATSVEGDRLKMTQVTDVLPAGTGVIVRAKAGTYTFTEIEGEYDAIEGNLLVGTTENTYITAAAGYNYYVLAQKDGVVGMYRPKLTNGQFLNNANKAYLALDMGNLGIFDDETNTDEEGGQLSNRLRFDFGGTTGIGNSQFTIDSSQLTIHDLHGRRITDTEGLKGVYIVNGKKVVFK